MTSTNYQKQLESDQQLFDSQINAQNHQIMSSLNNLYTFDYTNWKDWILAISTGIVGILIIATIFLSRKICTLNAAVAVATLPVADALETSFNLPPLIHPKLLVSVPKSISENTPSVFDFQIDIFVQSKLFQTALLMTIIIILIFIAIQTYNPKSYVIFDRKTTMAFNIANALEMVTLTLASFPDDITTFKFESENDIKNIRVIQENTPKNINGVGYHDTLSVGSQTNRIWKRWFRWAGNRPSNLEILSTPNFM